MATIDSLDRPLRKLARILAEQPGVPVPHDAVIDRMWPALDYPKAHAQHHLHQLVYRIREAYFEAEGSYIIATHPVGYVWLGELLEWRRPTRLT